MEATRFSPPNTLSACLPRTSDRPRNRSASSTRRRSRAWSTVGGLFGAAGGRLSAVEPPETLKPAIDRRLFSRPGSAPVRRRRQAACGRASPSGAALRRRRSPRLRVYAADPVHQPARPAAARCALIASLAADGSDVQLSRHLRRGRQASVAVACLRRTRDRPRLRTVDDRRPESRRFRWASFLPAQPRISSITPEIREKLASGAVLAISLEPLAAHRRTTHRASGRCR